MIPLRDDAPRFSYPGVTLVLVLLNVAVFLYQVYLSLVSAQAQMVFVETFGAIPLRAGHALAGKYPLIEGVAWWAHVGGFVAGAALIWSRPRRRRYRRVYSY